MHINEIKGAQKYNANSSENDIKQENKIINKIIPNTIAYLNSTKTPNGFV